MVTQEKHQQSDSLQRGPAAGREPNLRNGPIGCGGVKALVKDADAVPTEGKAATPAVY